jgi:uncharacterized protein
MSAHGVTARSGNGTGRHEEWLDHTRVFLQPIAAPSILGLFGFAAGMWAFRARDGLASAIHGTIS